MKETPKERTIDYQAMYEGKKDIDDVTLKTTKVESSHVTQDLPDKAETSASEAELSSGDASTTMIPPEKEDDHITGL